MRGDSAIPMAGGGPPGSLGGKRSARAAAPAIRPRQSACRARARDDTGCAGGTQHSIRPPRKDERSHHGRRFRPVTSLTPATPASSSALPLASVMGPAVLSPNGRTFTATVAKNAQQTPLTCSSESREPGVLRDETRTETKPRAAAGPADGLLAGGAR